MNKINKSASELLIKMLRRTLDERGIAHTENGEDIFFSLGKNVFRVARNQFSSGFYVSASKHIHTFEEERIRSLVGKRSFHLGIGSGNLTIENAERKLNNVLSDIFDFVDSVSNKVKPWDMNKYLAAKKTDNNRKVIKKILENEWLFQEGYVIENPEGHTLTGVFEKNGNSIAFVSMPGVFSRLYYPVYNESKMMAACIYADDVLKSSPSSDISDILHGNRRKSFNASGEEKYSPVYGKYFGFEGTELNARYFDITRQKLPEDETDERLREKLREVLANKAREFSQSSVTMNYTPFCRCAFSNGLVQIHLEAEIELSYNGASASFVRAATYVVDDKVSFESVLNSFAEDYVYNLRAKKTTIINFLPLNYDRNTTRKLLGKLNNILVPAENCQYLQNMILRSTSDEASCEIRASGDKNSTSVDMSEISMQSPRGVISGMNHILAHLKSVQEEKDSNVFDVLSRKMGF